MTWTTPRNWSTGELVTAADLNSQVRDNLNYLNTNVNAVTSNLAYLQHRVNHPIPAAVVGTAGYDITSSTFTTVGTLSTPLFLYSQTLCLFWADLSWVHNITGGEARLRFLINGTGLGHSVYGQHTVVAPVAGYIGAVSLHWYEFLPAGPNSIALQAATGGGTLNLAHFHGRMSVLSLKMVS